MAGETGGAPRFSGAAGVDEAALLRELRQGSTDLRDVHAPDGTVFRIWWSDGYVVGPVELEDGVSWCAGDLTFKRSPRQFGKRHAGRLLTDLYPHPLLSDASTIVSAEWRRDRYARLTCSQRLYPFILEEARLISVAP